MYLSKLHFVKANLANVGFWVKPGMYSSIYIISTVIYWNLENIYVMQGTQFFGLLHETQKANVLPLNYD